MEQNIASYRWYITYYNRQIDDLCSEINRYTDLYESLRAFKRTAENSQNAFNSINNSKKKILGDVASVKSNNSVASKYYTGLRVILNGTGTQIVAAAYMGLIRQITIKLTKYRTEINDCQRQIGIYRQKIRDLEYRIEEEKNKEEEIRKDG